jgi:hypothetical protein
MLEHSTQEDSILIYTAFIFETWGILMPEKSRMVWNLQGTGVVLAVILLLRWAAFN